MAGPIYEWGSWRFEPAEYRLTRHGVVVPLPAKTLDLLGVLIGQAPHLASKENILATVWSDAAVEEGNIAFHVAALRRVLDLDGERSCLETVRGRGYRFVAPVVSRSPAPSLRSAVEPATVAVLQPAPRRRANNLGIIATAILIAALGLFAVARSRPAEWSVVVLPFDVGGTGDDQGGFAPELAAYTASRLELAGIRVRPLAGGPEGEAPQDAGVRVGANALLTGTLQPSGDGWRVSVRLIRTSDGTRTWHWIFDVSPDENRPANGPDDAGPRLQGMIADRIASGLKRRLAEGID